MSVGAAATRMGPCLPLLSISSIRSTLCLAVRLTEMLERGRFYVNAIGQLKAFGEFYLWEEQPGPTFICGSAAQRHIGYSKPLDLQTVCLGREWELIG